MLHTAKLSLLSLMLVAAPIAGFAQSTDDTVTIDTPDADASPAVDLNMGTPVDGAETAAADDTELRVGQPYIREEFGDWALRCLKSEEGDDPCQLYQLLMDADGNAVAEVSTFPLPAGGEAAAGATFVVPLETLLTQALRLTIDGGQPKVYPFTFCNQAGCVARVGFTAAEVAQLKRGAGATVRMVPAAAPDQEVTLDMSLTGFTAGFDSVDS